MKLNQRVTIVLLCLLVGCTSVVTEIPIGVKPTEIKANEWNGTWVGAGETYIVKVVDEKLGKINIGVIVKEDGAFKLKNINGLLTETNKIRYVNLYLSQITEKQEIKEKYPNHYLWARYKKEKETIIIWHTNNKEIKQLIKDQQILGLVDSNYIKLNDPADDKITFDLEDPRILRRVVKKR